MKSKLSFIISMIIFGTIGIFVRQINLQSSEIAMLRGVLGSLFLTAIIVIMKKKVSFKSIRSNIVLLILSSIALGFNWIFLFQSYKYTTISNATLSYYFAPVFVMLLSPFVLEEKFSYRRVLCIGAAMLGMFFIVGNGGEKTGQYNNLIGIGYGLVAAIFYGALMLLNKFIKNLSGLEITLVQLLIASIVLVPYVFFTEGTGVLKITASSIPYILIVGILHTGIAFLLFFSGMQKLKGQTIAALSYIDPISSLIISTLILKESMTFFQMLGGVLILGSTFISESKSI